MIDFFELTLERTLFWSTACVLQSSHLASVSSNKLETNVISLRRESMEKTLKDLPFILFTEIFSPCGLATSKYKGDTNRNQGMICNTVEKS